MSVSKQKNEEGMTTSTPDSDDRSEMENEKNGSASLMKKISFYGFILVLASVAMLLIVYLKWQKSPVEPKLSPPKPTVNYSALIQVHSDQASRRNLNALEVFEMEVNRVLKKHDAKLVIAATEAAKEASDYGSSCKIVYFLALDQVKGQNETESYLNGEIKPLITPAIQALAIEVDATVKKLDHELRRSTVQLAYDLAALGPAEDDREITVDVDATGRLDLHKPLRNLGFNTIGIAVSSTFDAVVLSKSQLVGVLWTKIPPIAARLFGKQVAKVATSAAVAAADGPLPVGDIIALGGMIWTGYDIYASRKEFEREITTSLDNLLSDVSHDVHQQAVGYATAMVKQYQKLQDEIGSQSLNHI